MDVNELYEKMESLKPDSMDELDLIDEGNNLSIRIWKENLEPDDSSGAWYYRIIINGRKGRVCEFAPDIVVAGNQHELYMNVAADGKDGPMDIFGFLEVSDWKVRGE